MRLNLKEIAETLGAAPEFVPDAAVTSVVTDSRQARPGSLFVCLNGEKLDGHDFIADAAGAGCLAVIANRETGAAGVPIIVVDDTVRALGEIALLWRKKTSAMVIGVTGTAGKTTLKETLSAILRMHGKTACNRLNFNNQIGMPLAMLDCDGDEQFWVMEAGISHDGDMDDLGAMLEPDMAIILNVGDGHVEGLGARGVAWHKARMLSYIRPGGVAVLSADYPRLVEEAEKYRVRKKFFSTVHGRAEYCAEDAGASGGFYRLSLDGESLGVQTPFQAEFGAEICAAAAAAAHVLGANSNEIADGLKNATMPAHRLTRLRAGQWHLLDDTYNANPLSMRRMLSAAADSAREHGGNLVLVLGEMGELGDDSARLHELLGGMAADALPHAVFWKGNFAAEVLSGLRNAGYSGFWAQVDTPDALLAAFARALKDVPALRKGGVMLFKGSRANRLEKFMEAFCERTAGCAGRGDVL